MKDKYITIGDRRIGVNYKPLLIVEIGINHGGDIGVAKNLVHNAYKAGAECIKHQTHIVDDEMTDEAKTIIPPNADISIWDIMQECSLSLDEERELKSYTESLGLIYLSTPFSRKAADFLQDIDVPAFKIGSGECDNLPLIRHISSFGKPIIMSTGMQTIESIRASVDILENSGVEYALLECTNLYPSPPEIVSLGGINELKANFPNAIIGFSDHSIGPQMVLASIAMGASIIERHFTDSRYRIGPDISCSMDPAEVRFIIDRSSEIHTALNNKKMRSKSEDDVYLFARGSIVADKNLTKGSIIGESDIWARRPGSGEIPAHDFDKLIGKKINKDIKKNSQIKWEDVS
ncbi:N-acetylneuraminate synthase family protein [Gammaproteobacteria bacterium]|nr:N-acetylneuraminate synthase family protein [Gammaproteobacteria bacterium]